MSLKSLSNFIFKNYFCSEKWKLKERKGSKAKGEKRGRPKLKGFKPL